MLARRYCAPKNTALDQGRFKPNVRLGRTQQFWMSGLHALPACATLAQSSMNAPKAKHATKISRSRIFTPHPGFVPSAKMKGSTNPNAMQINSVQSRLHERTAEIVRVAKSSTAGSAVAIRGSPPFLTRPRRASRSCFQPPPERRTLPDARRSDWRDAPGVTRAMTRA